MTGGTAVFDIHPGWLAMPVERRSDPEERAPWDLGRFARSRVDLVEGFARMRAACSGEAEWDRWLARLVTGGQAERVRLFMVEPSFADVAARAGTSPSSVLQSLRAAHHRLNRAGRVRKVSLGDLRESWDPSPKTLDTGPGSGIL